ncbi:chemotaxis protein CheW [Conexibacter sp. DBS9H8]|uniref:chemotaxis protein CheW n=1 Tax=Conexibacter sp. DBS9H8 TaxID=2937801 RepID=UPI00200C7620|nr:chemotaxis protein CheW [Conexibacter sp. DBS9H8]
MRAIVTFRAADTRYGIDVSAVSRVLERESIRPLPDPLPGVSGLVSLSGRSLPVLGLLAPAGAHLLILRSEGLDFGLLVDEVTGVLRMRASDLQAPPAGQAAPTVLSTVADTLLLDPAVLTRHLRGAAAPAQEATGGPEPTPPGRTAGASAGCCSPTIRSSPATLPRRRCARPDMTSSPPRTGPTPSPSPASTCRT